MIRKLLLRSLAAAVVSCAAAEEAPLPAAPPMPAPPGTATTPLVATAGAPGPTSPATSAGPGPLAPPVMARFVDVTTTGARLAVGSRCDVLYVAVAKGTLTAAGQPLAQGDVLMASRVDPNGLELKGSALAVVVTALHDCPAGSAAPSDPMSTRVARSGDAKDLAWAGGTMHAKLDLEKDASPDVYVGRLQGTGPVAPHDHASSWELLCAIEGAGTFTLDGVAKHIVGPTVVAVPPGRKHAWQPDPGVRLVAVQVYAPPGPEQRFKALSKP